MITGLSQGTLDGDDTSSAWRAMKATRAALFGVMPRIGARRVSPPFLLREEGLLPERRKGKLSQALSSKRRSPGLRLEGFLVGGALGGGVQREAGKPSADRSARAAPTPCAGRARGQDARPSRTRRRSAACGEMPWVKRASVARDSRSMVSKEGPSGGGESILARLGRPPDRGAVTGRAGAERRALIHGLRVLPKARRPRLASCQMGARQAICRMHAKQG